MAMALPCPWRSHGQAMVKPWRSHGFAGFLGCPPDSVAAGRPLATNGCGCPRSRPGNSSGRLLDSKPLAVRSPGIEVEANRSFGTANGRL